MSHQPEPLKVLIINGPNLNLLGQREPHIYGSSTLADLEQHAKSYGGSLGLTVECFQSNHEGALIDRIHAAASDGTNYIAINAGAYTHTSIGLRDALAGVRIPFCEVHISNVYSRETFRHHSYLSSIAQGVLCGFGIQGYDFALQFAAKSLKTITN